MIDWGRGGRRAGTLVSAGEVGRDKTSGQSTRHCVEEGVNEKAGVSSGVGEVCWLNSRARPAAVCGKYYLND